MADCGASLDLSCRDKPEALRLKLAAVALILFASALGVALPLVGRRLSFLRTDGNVFFIAKAFAAGVILATAFVHMLPDAANALNSSCLPAFPWSKYPFFGLFSMLAALGTLVIDFAATEFYGRKKNHGGEIENGENGEPLPAHAGGERYKAVADAPSSKFKDVEGGQNGNEQLHIVGMNAHAASHVQDNVPGHLGHTHDLPPFNDSVSHIRHVVIAQVLEIGILAHSVIIGIALGVSQSPCTIRPLMAALVFHQFFEGFALGGCISQAAFNYVSATVMAFFFAVTTPAGIAVGLGIASSYNENSPRALIVEGIFDSISAGILVYMSLVDLIAADFLSKRLQGKCSLQLWSYLALFSGALAMAAVGIWA